ncbi:MAG TPA: hypothetical protein P5026_03560 [Kiritimatiellia bacterium]|nr:hypothetical protein [Kiritimatiellia bacterium]HRU70617.1 hypothetical protein [Kiritimatiellia bacterium]
MRRTGKTGSTGRLLAAFQPPKSLNAYIDNNTYTRQIVGMIHETLLSVDSTTTEFVPYLAPCRPPVKPGHVRLRARFVDEHEAPRLPEPDFFRPQLTGFPDVVSVLLARPERLFLYVMPIASRA